MFCIVFFFYHKTSQQLQSAQARIQHLTDDLAKKDKQLKKARQVIQRLQSKPNTFNNAPAHELPTQNRKMSGRNRNTASEWNFDTEVTSNFEESENGRWSAPNQSQTQQSSRTRPQVNSRPKKVHQPKMQDLQPQSSSSAWEDKPIEKGITNAQIEAEAASAEMASMQCSTCGRTFNASAYQRHHKFVFTLSYQTSAPILIWCPVVCITNNIYSQRSFSVWILAPFHCLNHQQDLH